MNKIIIPSYKFIILIVDYYAKQQNRLVSKHYEDTSQLVYKCNMTICMTDDCLSKTIITKN